MRIGIISDIHGNIYAFERVAEEIRREGVDYIVFLGDLVFNGLYPQECYDLLKTLNIKYCIKGNTDSNIEEFTDFVPRNEFERNLHSMIEFTFKKISRECMDDLESWRISVNDRVEGHSILYCHGSPYSFKDKMTMQDSDLSRIEEKLENEDSGLIFCGHTHIREQFGFAGKTIINFGAIGYNYDKNENAGYGIADFSGTPSFKFREAAYDVEKYKTDIRKQKTVFGSDLILLLEHGMKLKNELTR